MNRYQPRIPTASALEYIKKRIMIFFLLMGIAAVGFSALHKSNLAAKSTSLVDVDNLIEVEYIESTGAQWIDTGIVPSNSVISIEMKVDSLGASWCSWFSCAGTQCTACRYAQSSLLWAELKGAQGRFDGSSIIPRTVIKIDSANNTYTKDDTTKALGGSGQITSSLFLFGKNGGNGDATGCSKVKIYWITIEREGEKILDFLPVRFRNEIGLMEGAMYDRVTGEVFRNQGTGSFIIGPDK